MLKTVLLCEFVQILMLALLSWWTMTMYIILVLLSWTISGV